MPGERERGEEREEGGYLDPWGGGAGGEELAGEELRRSEGCLMAAAASPRMGASVWGLEEKGAWGKSEGNPHPP
jgi:hypothetical protein